MGDTSADMINKRLEKFDAEIAFEEARVAEIKGRMSDQPWYERRAGLTKHLYNLYEMRQIILLKSIFPDLTFYGQAKYAAFELPNGRVVPIKDVRIPDVIQIFGDEVQPHELKTSNVITKSVAGGKSQRVEVDFKNSAYLKEQLAKERSIVRTAGVLKAKILIQCDDPVTGSSVTIKVDPKNLRVSAVMTYGKVPDKLLGQSMATPATGLMKLTAPGSVAADGTIRVTASAQSSLPTPPRTTVKPSVPAPPPELGPGRPTVEQRGTPKPSEQGPVEIGDRAVKGKAASLADRFVKSNVVGGAMKVAGGVNIALAPVSVYHLAQEFSGEAEAKRVLDAILPSLKPDDFSVGDRFVVRYNVKNDMDRDYRTISVHISVEDAADTWPYNLMPKLPVVKRFVVEKAVIGPLSEEA